MNFICEPCRTGADLKGSGPLIDQVKKDWHKKCKGGTWCECLHRSK